MQNIIITIGREFGSGGRYIGQMASKKLNIPFYDKELIDKTHEKSGYNYSKLNEYDEKSKNKLIKNLNYLNISPTETSYEENTSQTLISKTIEELADTSSCIILGRNSNNILKNKNNVINIFIYSNDLEFKIRRKMNLENLSYEESLNKLKKVDKQRKKYYETLNPKQIWGDKKHYDYLIDSSILGVDLTVDLIIDIYNKTLKKNNRK